MGWSSAGIEAVTGKFGGGKSYWCTVQLRNHFIRGGFCGGNLALDWEEMKKHARDVYRKKLRDEQWIPLTDEQIAHFPDYIPASRDKSFPVHLALDECGIFFNAKAWNQIDPRVEKFLPQPRKYGIRILAIVQELGRMVVNIREQAAVVHRFRDLNKLPWGDGDLTFRNPLTGKSFQLLPYFVHSAYDYKEVGTDGKLGKNSKPLLNEHIRKDARIYRLYNSYNYHGGNALVGEVAGRVELESVTWRERFGESMDRVRHGIGRAAGVGQTVFETLKKI